MWNFFPRTDRQTDRQTDRHPKWLIESRSTRLKTVKTSIYPSVSIFSFFLHPFLAMRKMVGNLFINGHKGMHQRQQIKAYNRGCQKKQTNISHVELETEKRRKGSEYGWSLMERIIGHSERTDMTERIIGHIRGTWHPKATNRTNDKRPIPFSRLRAAAL